jgi:DNA-binding response OmpR family regulator
MPPRQPTPDRDAARELDRRDPLARFRRAFHLPKHGTRPACYLSGHSLGLMPRAARAGLAAELDRWGELGVEGHLGDGWLDYHRRFSAPLAPGRNGWEVLKELRIGSEVPVIMLTARGGEAERIGGLELGADDYVTKPFSPRELVARVKAVLRRAQGQGSPPPSVEILEVDDLVVDLGAREATQSGAVIQLTAREFDLLAFLVRHPRQAFRREELLQEVWGYSYGDASTVTVHIRRLREKIEDEPSHPRHIATVWGVGYRWDP